MPEFDFDRLRAANATLFKWGEHFKIHNYKYLNFVYTLEKNKDSVLSSLKTKKLRKQFEKDCKTMFFAKEIENDLIMQYRPMVHHVLRRFNISSDDVYDSALSVGLQSLRGAIWRYSRDSVKFITYAMNGVICGVRGIVSDMHESKTIKLKRIKPLLRDENTSAMFTMGKHVLQDKKAGDPADIVAHGKFLDENILVNLAGLDEDEKNILNFFLSGDGYREKYREYHNEKYGKIPARSRIVQIWKNSQLKIWKAVLNIRGEEALRTVRSPVCSSLLRKQRRILESPSRMTAMDFAASFNEK